MVHKKDARRFRIQILCDNGIKDIFERIENTSRYSKGKIAYELLIRSLAETLDKVNCNIKDFDNYFNLIEKENQGWTIQTIFKQTLSLNKLKGGNNEI